MFTESEIFLDLIKVFEGALVVGLLLWTIRATKN